MHEPSSEPAGGWSHDHVSESISLAASLRAAAEEATSFRMRQCLLDVARKTREGMTLEEALRGDRRVPRFIGDVHALVRLGVPLGEYVIETTVAERRRKEILRAIQRASAYPVFLLSMVFVLYFLFDVFVAPSLHDMVAEFDNVSLRRTSVIGWSGARIVYLVALGVLVAVPLGLLALSRLLSPAQWRRAVLAMPGIGSVSYYLELFPVLRRLSVLVDRGVPLTQSLQVIADGLRGRLLAPALREMSDDVERGMSLVQAMLEADLPPTIIPLVSRGEASGRLGQALRDSAELLEAALRNATSTLAVFFPPVAFVGVLLIVSAAVWQIYLVLSSAMRLHGVLV